MIRSNRMKIVFILLFFLGLFVFSQNKQANDDKDRNLREEILSVYQSRGEEGLRNFVKKQRDRIPSMFIKKFARLGFREKKEEWLKISEIIADEEKDEKNLADIYLRMGEYFRLISKYKKAIVYLDKALPIYKKLNNLMGQGDIWLRKGEIYLVIGEKSKALEMYEKALSFFEKGEVSWGLGNVYLRKGDIYFYFGDYSMAPELYDKALHFFEKAKDLLGQGNVYLRKGNTFTRIGNNLKAVEMYDKALPFFEKAGDFIGVGNIYLRKGVIYFYATENSKAIEMYDKALHSFKIAGDFLGQANVYSRKGDINSIIGENSKALVMYDKALNLFERVGNTLGQGGVYIGMGDIYFICNYNLKALKMYSKALALYESLGEFIGQGNIYLKQGIIYFQTGNNYRSLKMYDMALHFFEKAGVPIGQGNSYREKGNVYFNTGKNSKALEMYDKALHFFEKAGVPIGQANVCISKGKIYLKIGEIPKAIQMYDKALTFYEKVNSPIGQGNVYFGKGEIYFILKANSKSLSLYDKALRFYMKAGNIGGEYSTSLVKAKVLKKMGKKKKALNFFEKGMTSLEKLRTQTAFSEMKRTLMESVYEQYEEAVLFMLENKYDVKGFKYAEAIRARVFLDRLGEGLVPLEKGLKPKLKEKRDNLVAKLSNISKEMHETGGNKKKKLAELKEKYRKTRDEFEDLLIKIRIDNPFYASVRYQQPISVQVLQKEVLKKGETMVRYFITPDKVYVFLVSKKRFKVVPLEVKAEKIKSYVNRWLLAVKSNDTRELEMYGKLLYWGLFKPIESKLQGGQNIIIIPDSHLEKIPFESFIIDEKKSGRTIFLLEKYRLKYVQSASILSILRKHYRRERETKNFIAFGDPVYDYENFKQGQPEQGSMKIFATESTEVTEDEIKEIFSSRYARVGGLMNRLQGSGEEVRTIARLFENKSQKSLIYLREQATEDNAKAANLKEFDYIHFACHGLLNDDFQSLVLSQDIPGSQDDGYFTLNEIINCDYNAKLVVLSGCQTGSGKMERAEGVTGLTRAVMYAGTPAVIASLWHVDDPATKELMVTFYRNMLEKNMDNAEALRQAKLELIKSIKYSSPLFWSAFVMYGE